MRSLLMVLLLSFFLAPVFAADVPVLDAEGAQVATGSGGVVVTNDPPIFSPSSQGG